MKKSITIIFKWGALLGIALSLLQLAKIHSKSFDFYAFGPVIDLFNMLIFIAVLYLGLKEIKEECFDGLISFSKAFFRGSLIVIIAFVVVFLYLNVQYGVLFKEKLPEINIQNMEKFKDNIQKDSIKQIEFDQALVSQILILKSEKDRIILDANIDSINGILISNRIDTLYSFYTHYIKNHRDSSEILTLGNFDDYSKTSLMFVLGKYLSTLPQTDTMAPYINTIIINGIDQFATVSPLTLRFEEGKSKVPIHTSSISAALTYSLSVILYGILFNIFIALYIYDKKKLQPKESTEE